MAIKPSKYTSKPLSSLLTFRMLGQIKVGLKEENCTIHILTLYLLNKGYVSSVVIKLGFIEN